MQSKRLSHFLLTRFNIATTFTSTSPVLEEDWLNRRFELFETFCFPSVSSQTNTEFCWIILFHPQTPAAFIERFSRLQKNSPHLEIIIGEKFKRTLAQLLPGIKDKDFLVTTRLDNDDAICQTFIDETQLRINQAILDDRIAISEENPLFLDFIHGYFAAGDYLYERTDIANHFCSMAIPFPKCEALEPKDIKLILDMNHKSIESRPGYQRVDMEPAWIEVIHDTNTRNCLRGDFHPCGSFSLDFSINWSPRSP